MPTRNANNALMMSSSVRLAMWLALERWSTARGTSMEPSVVTGVANSSVLSVKLVAR